MVDQFAAVAGSAEPIFGRTESLRLASILDELHRLSSAQMLRPAFFQYSSFSRRL